MTNSTIFIGRGWKQTREVLLDQIPGRGAGCWLGWRGPLCASQTLAPPFGVGVHLGRYHLVLGKAAKTRSGEQGYLDKEPHLGAEWVLALMHPTCTSSSSPGPKQDLPKNTQRPHSILCQIASGTQNLKLLGSGWRVA